MSALMWLILAVALFCVEALVPGAFFLWFAIAAIVVSALVYFFSMITLTTQVIIFSVLSLLFLMAYMFYKRNNPTQIIDNGLNTRTDSLIGDTVEVLEVKGSSIKVKVADSIWLAKLNNSQPITIGDQVKIIGAKGVVLMVEKI